MTQRWPERFRTPGPRTTFCILALFHVAAFVLTLSLCNIKYEVSDDFMMEMILSGVYTGNPDPHIMFSNVIWGSFLVPFYRLFPGISWYFWSQMLVCLLSYIAISYVLSRNTKWYTAILTTILIWAFSAMDLYILPQFTKTALAAVISGSLLFLWALFSGHSRKAVIAGSVLVLVGSLIRDMAIYVAAPSILLYLIWESLRVLREEGWTARDLVKRIFLPGILLVCLVFACIAVDDWIYAMDEEYRFFREYSSARVAIVDYLYPEYAAIAEPLQSIGVSENDYNLIITWSYDDPEVFGLETMRQVGQILEQYRSENPLPITQVLWQMLARRPMFYPGAICCILLGLYCIFLDLKKLWVPALSAALIFVFFFYFSSVGRCVYRVEFGFFFSAMVLIAYVCRTSIPAVRTGIKGAAAVILSLCLLLQMVCYFPDHSFRELDTEAYREYVDETFYYSWAYKREKYSKTISPGQIHPEFLSTVEDHPERIYLLDFNTAVQTLYLDFSPFDSAAAVFPENLHYLGAVTIHHPATDEIETTLGCQGLLDALVQEDVYFVSNHTGIFALNFLQEHGYPQAIGDVVGELDGYQIWQYSPK